MEICKTVHLCSWELDVMVDAGCLTKGAISNSNGEIFFHVKRDSALDFSEKLRAYSNHLWSLNLDSRLGEADTASRLAEQFYRLS